MAKSKLDTAREAEQHAADTVAQWEAKLQEAAHGLAAAEATAGHDALRSGDPSQAAANVAELRSHVEVLGRTVEAAKAAHTEATADTAEAEAAAQRTEAGKVRDRAEQHEQRTAELLAALADHEGVRYVVDQPTPGVASDRGPQTPYSEQLRNQAAGLDREADKLDQRAAELRKQAQPAPDPEAANPWNTAST